MAIVTFKCSDAEKAEIEVRSHGDVSWYIKARLLGANAREDLLYQILERLGDGDGEACEATGRCFGSDALGMLTELLLLMRMSVKMDTKKKPRPKWNALDSKSGRQNPAGGDNDG